MKNISNKNLIIALVIIIVFTTIAQAFSIYAINNFQEEKLKLIGDKVQLTYVENTGGVFGIGKDDTFGFAVLSILMIGIMLYFLIAQKDRIDNKTTIAVSLMIAGGISNLIDRIAQGAIIDYIDIFNLIKFPVFNLADIFIFVGWVIFVVAVIMYWKNENEKIRKFEDSIRKNSEDFK